MLIQGGRNAYIDFLRSLGLICLIVVHTYPPVWLKVFRSFDVPLMVFVSALCFYPSSMGLVKYIIKRVKRIYVPVALFLTLYFLTFSIVFLLFGKPELKMDNIVGSYLLLNKPSIGYVWIMRVFLMIAVVMPITYRFVHRLSFSGVLLILGLLFSLSECMAYFLEGESGIFGYIFEASIPYLIGYLMFVCLAFKAKEFSKRQLWIIFLMASTVTVLLTFFNGQNTFLPSQYKYPPSNIFLTYGLALCALLWIARPIIPEKIVSSKICLFLSGNSMWLYLWHIVGIQLVSPLGNSVALWSVRFLIVSAVAVILTIVYKKVIQVFPERVVRLIG